MKQITKVVAYDVAGKLQLRAGEFNCDITQIGLIGGGKVRIDIAGMPGDIKALFNDINEPLDDGSL